jgi:hypothetical protein
VFVFYQDAVPIKKDRLLETRALWFPAECCQQPCWSRVHRGFVDPWLLLSYFYRAPALRMLERIHEYPCADIGGSPAMPIDFTVLKK